MTKEDIKNKMHELKTDEEIETFIKSRIEELESIAQEKVVGQGYTTTFDDYISSKVSFKPVASLDDKECPNLIYDDIEPYCELVKILVTKHAYLNELFLFTPIMFEIFDYMSSQESVDHMEDTVIERHLLYFIAMQKGRENISIKEFHNNKCACCSENAGLAHNIFKILGIDSQYVVGKREEERHAFNIIFPNGYGNLPAVLFDPSFRISFTNQKGNRYSMGYFKVLTSEEYNNMLSGNATLIDLEKSARDLIRYYPVLMGCIPDYENAHYRIGFAGSLKTETDDKTSNAKSGSYVI